MTNPLEHGDPIEVLHQLGFVKASVYYVGECGVYYDTGDGWLRYAQFEFVRRRENHEDFPSVPLDDAGTVKVRYEYRGEIQPMPYESSEEEK